jgi:hypothetical protein
LVVGSIIFISIFFYSIVLAKLMPSLCSGGPQECKAAFRWMDHIRNDEFFCLVIPLTLVPATVLGYLNWVAMEFYQAN